MPVTMATEQFARVRALILRGALHEARSEAQAIGRDAEAQGDRATWASALRDEGVTRFERFEYAAAVMCFERAVELSASTGDLLAHAELLSWCAVARAADDALAPARTIAEQGLSALTTDEAMRIDDVSASAVRLRARVRENLAFVCWIDCRHDEARALAAQAVAARKSLLRDDDDALEWAGALVMLGLIEQAAHRLAAAADAYDAALEARRRILGPRHGYVGYCLHHQAQIELDRGLLDEAEATTVEALGIVAQALGQHHPNVGSVLATLAAIRLEAGNLVGGLEALERALDVSQRSFGHESPQHGVILLLLGTAQRALARAADAVDTLEAAVRMLVPAHESRGETLNNCLVSLLDAYIEAEMPLRAVTFLGEIALRFEAMSDVDLALHARVVLGNAVAQIATGRAPAALEIVQPMSKRAQAELGPESPLSVELCAAEAAALAELGRLDEAQVILQRIEKLGELH